jgi:hypothetical protein
MSGATRSTGWQVSACRCPPGFADTQAERGEKTNASLFAHQRASEAFYPAGVFMHRRGGSELLCRIKVWAVNFSLINFPHFKLARLKRGVLYEKNSSLGNPIQRIPETMLLSSVDLRPELSAES